MPSGRRSGFHLSLPNVGNASTSSSRMTEYSSVSLLVLPVGCAPRAASGVRRRRGPPARRRGRPGALALRELRSLAGLVQAGLLALDLAGVACQEALALQHRPELRIGLDERPGDAVADRAGLSRWAAALDARTEVVRALGAGDLQRRQHRRAVGGAREVLLQRPAVDPGHAVARAQDHARDGRLPLAGALVLGERSHQRVSSFGSWAPCGCSGPA